MQYGFVDQYHAVYRRTRPSLDFTSVGFGTSDYFLFDLNTFESTCLTATITKNDKSQQLIGISTKNVFNI
jgi:hypothetical protein